MATKIYRYKRPNQEHPTGDSTLAFLFFLGFIEFCGASIATLLLDTDPKNAFLFGYSASRIALILISLMLGIGMLNLGIKAYQGKKGKIHSVIDRITSWTEISFLLFLIGCLVALIPPSMLGKYQYGFERLQPLLMVLCFIPMQLSLRFFTKMHCRMNKKFWLPVLISLGAILLLVGFIVLTQLGITPDKVFWNVAGMPLTSSQLVMILIGILIILEVILVVKKFIPGSKLKYLDIGLCLLVFSSAIVVWNSTPFSGHFFTELSSPLNQPFPFSDARGRDIGALSILIGQGISFNEHTVSPLHEVFLAILHGIAGFDYNLLTQLQLIFLALIPVVLYLFGKSFKNRFLGLLLAMIVIVRQSNAILLSRMIAGSNPFILTTEMPTYLGISALVGLVFLWIKKTHKSPWIALLSGAVLGMASLIRVNPVILFPVIPAIALAAMWKTKKWWLTQATIFTLGFFMFIIPWSYTGRTVEGYSFFFLKFYNVIDTRYDPIGQVPGSIEDNSTQEAFTPSRVRMRISSGNNTDPVTLMDIYSFPGFVVNHFLHNIVASTLALPDSAEPSDQVLKDLALRPYWVETEEWTGELLPGQIMFLIINISLISLGIGWSWKQWRWAGLLPLVIFLAYLSSMGFARVSGSRYIVPVDWVVFFYYAIGLTMILGLIAKLFRMKTQGEFEATIETENPSDGGKKFPWEKILITIMLVCAAASIPIADNLIPPDKTLCEDQSIIASTTPLYKGNPDKVLFLTGRLLYPTIKKGALTFTLLSCQRVNEMEIIDFNNRISSGQLVVMVMEYPLGEGKSKMMISVEGETPEVIWETK